VEKFWWPYLLLLVVFLAADLQGQEKVFTVKRHLLLAYLESWNITAGTQVHEVKININQLTGAQLEKLIKGLPDGVTYGLNLEKE